MVGVRVVGVVKVVVGLVILINIQTLYIVDKGQVKWVLGGSGGLGRVMGGWWVIGYYQMDSGCHKLSENTWFVWSKM